MIIIFPLLIISILAIAWWLRPRSNAPKSQKLVVFAIAVPSLVLAVISVILQLTQNASGTAGVSDISNALFVAGLIVVLAAVLAAAVCVIAKKWELAKGIGFGVSVAVAFSILELGLLEWLGGG
jgi:hypothetical protein